eukprot:scaffold24801_cov22-Tisochrysis_lutea.AAC.1
MEAFRGGQLLHILATALSFKNAYLVSVLPLYTGINCVCVPVRACPPWLHTVCATRPPREQQDLVCFDRGSYIAPLVGGRRGSGGVPRLACFHAHDGQASCLKIPAQILGHSSLRREQALLFWLEANQYLSSTSAEKWQQVAPTEQKRLEKERVRCSLYLPTT